MSKVPTQIRIDEDIKKYVYYLFNELGLDMSTAVNLFLHQCILNKGIPFEVKQPAFNIETIEALIEGEHILRDIYKGKINGNEQEYIKLYDSIEEMNKDLFSDIE